MNATVIPEALARHPALPGRALPLAGIEPAGQAEVEAELGRAAAKSARAAAAAASVLLACAGAAQAGWLPGGFPVSSPSMSFAGASGSALLFLALRGRDLPSRWGHPCLLLLCGFALAMVLPLAGAGGNARAGAAVMLLLAAGAGLFFSFRWFAVFCACALAGWAWSVAVSPDDADRAVWSAAVLGAAALAAWLNAGRSKAVREWSRLRLNETRENEARAAAISAAQETEERFRIMADACFEGIIFCSGDGTVKDLNKPAAALAGLDRSEMVGRKLSAFFAPESVPVLQRFAACGSAQRATVRILRPGAAALDVSIASGSVPLAGEKLSFISVRDASADQARERELREQGARIECQLRRYSVLPEAAEAGRQSDSWGAFAEQMVRIVRESFSPSMGCALLLPNPQLSLCRVAGSALDAAPVGLGIPYQESDRCPFQKALASGAPVFVPRPASREHLLPREIKHLDPGAYCVVPLLHEGKAVALLFAAETGPRQYSEEDDRFLRALAFAAQPEFAGRRAARVSVA